MGLHSGVDLIESGEFLYGEEASFGHHGIQGYGRVAL
jgi:hypothetical protein